MVVERKSEMGDSELVALMARLGSEGKGMVLRALRGAGVAVPP